MLEDLVIEKHLRRLRESHHLLAKPIEARQTPVPDHAGEHDAHQRLLPAASSDLP